jgi:hypothetical protein
VQDLGKFVNRPRGHRPLDAPLELLNGDPAVDAMGSELGGDLRAIAVRRPNVSALELVQASQVILVSRESRARQRG